MNRRLYTYFAVLKNCSAYCFCSSSTRDSRNCRTEAMCGLLLYCWSCCRRSVKTMEWQMAWRIGWIRLEGDDFVSEGAGFDLRVRTKNGGALFSDKRLKRSGIDEHVVGVHQLDSYEQRIVEGEG